MSTTAQTVACIGEPISWLRLERYAMARSDARIGEHVEACPACRACLDEIERDVVALPPLAVPAAAPARRRWWTFAVPAGVALAAAALLLLWLRPRGSDAPATGRDDVTSIKGVGIVEIDVVRERGGVIRDDVLHYAPGDRWKVLVTCATDKAAWIDAAVIEEGAQTADYPLAPARLTCGNRIALPGAFTLTGDKPHRICVRVAADREPLRALPRAREPGVACVTLTRE